MSTDPIRYTDRELATAKVDYNAKHTGGGFQNLILKGKEEVSKTEDTSESGSSENDAEVPPPSDDAATVTIGGGGAPETPDPISTLPAGALKGSDTSSVVLNALFGDGSSGKSGNSLDSLLEALGVGKKA